jgi:hypothetical protein
MGLRHTQPVSEENVERSRRVLEAFNARDMDALIVLFDPQVEVHARLAGLGEATIYNGHDGVRSWQADFDESGAASGSSRRRTSTSASRSSLSTCCADAGDKAELRQACGSPPWRLGATACVRR